MSETRRKFIKASAAFTVITVTKAGGQPARAAPPVVQKQIGLVVSTSKKTNHEAAFLQALSDNHWSPHHPNDHHADGKYGPGHDDLKNGAKDHIDNQMHLIVAAGGLPAAIAVATALKERSSSIPFVFLIGRYPTSSSGDDAAAADLRNSSNKAGGVDMNTPGQNERNFQFLRDNHGVSIDKIGLIVNDNDPISKPEVTAWTRITDGGKQPNVNFIYHLNGENDQGLSNLLAGIRNAKSKPAGIVVSSDPYLRSVGNINFDAQLRDASSAGGNFQGWVCYPFKEYLLASGRSIYSPYTPELATNVLTDQRTAYYQLGLKAVDALIQNPPQLTTWDSSSSSWVTRPFP